MYLPVLGRLSVIEWVLLVVYFSLAWLEFLITTITRILPGTIIDVCTETTKALYKFTPNPINLILSMVKGENEDIAMKYQYPHTSGKKDSKKLKLMTDILNSKDIQEMCQCFGYDIENKVFKTDDDYFLTIQRLYKPGVATNRNGKVVYFHHGLLMNSEIWVTMLDKYSNLPFLLYELGYDVWLGNNRGNKYSQKHLYYKLDSNKFWDFSLDEFAFFDIPNSIDYIIRETGKPQLTYIGFSQGTAQAFASVSVNPELNEKIDQIIAISPATTPHGLHSRFLDVVSKTSPNIMFALFSRKILMPSVLFWKRIMYPPLFNSSIDFSNYLLFNWKSENIEKDQKLSSYAHLYLTTSVKSVVHWFQIIAAKKFQMYYDSSPSASALNNMVYPLNNIRIPIKLIYGTSDSLVDIHVMLGQLPKKYTTAQPVEGHEHLDNIWGKDVSKTVFLHVLSSLNEPVNIQERFEKVHSGDIHNEAASVDINGGMLNNTQNVEQKAWLPTSEIETYVKHRRPSSGSTLIT